uniref:PHD finger protein 7 n=1 Tax=Terrapene triunguis TaxID=2587831 RepID=A0A674JKU1_9SAUR
MGCGGDLGSCCLFCSPSRCFQTCCVCGCKGASIACQGRKCTKNFHFPCGSERGCIYQFFGEFKSFCWKHRPVQRVRRRQQQAETICIICLESMPGKPSYSAMVCPACKHAWFHRGCIQGHALRAALYHFRCPRCRDMGTFQREMFRMGIKIPDRDAAWEADGAFSDQYHRHSRCDAGCCLYVGGREQFAEVGPWQLLLCNSCGSQGTHRRCASLGATRGPWECEDCAEPAGAGKERLERRRPALVGSAGPCVCLEGNSGRSWVLWDTGVICIGLCTRAPALGHQHPHFHRSLSSASLSRGLWEDSAAGGGANPMHRGACPCGEVGGMTDPVLARKC